MATTTPNLGLTIQSQTELFDYSILGENFTSLDRVYAQIMKKLSPHNHLDNPFFSTNQRGLSSYSGAAQYTVDRWKTTNADTVVDVLTNGVKLTNAVTGSGGYFQQTLEKPSRFLGKTLTLAAMQTNGTLSVATATLPTAFPAAVSQYATLSDNGVTIGAIQLSDTSAWVRVWSNPSETTRSFRWVALYEGSYSANTVPAPEPQIPAVELLECQRYHLPLSNYVRYPATRCTSSEIDFLIPIPVKFRYNPTIIGTLAVYAGATAQTGFSFSVVGFSPNAIAIRATKANHGLTSANGLCLQVTDAALNADL